MQTAAAGTQTVAIQVTAATAALGVGKQQHRMQEVLPAGH